MSRIVGVLALGSFLSMLILIVMVPDPPQPQLVRACTNGTRVSKQPNGELTFYSPGGAFFDAGFAKGKLPKGMTPEQFCN